VTSGTAKITQIDALMAITQSSQRAAINWQSFNLGSEAKINITQPSSSSVLLNRILGNSASQIFGQINANGQVIMSNPSGMYSSAHSRSRCAILYGHDAWHQRYRLHGGHHEVQSQWRHRQNCQ
jgi:filamentous hemagglutinin family protein